MNRNIEEHRKEFFERFIESADLKKEILVFDRLLGRPVWWITDKISRANLKALLQKSVFSAGGKEVKLVPLARGWLKKRNKKVFICNKVKRSKTKYSQCINSILKILDKAKHSRAMERFICPLGMQGFCLPLVQGDRVYGFIVLCHTTAGLSDDLLGVFSAYSDTVVKEVQKELELSKLYDTIRPRAIALSTFHTIYRLISSTLNFDELMPRLARLCLQVLRARRCSIMLLDESGKFLIPRTVVDLENKNAPHPRRIRVGFGLEGKIAQTADVVLKPSYLSVPLVDEDVIGVITIAHRIDHRPFSVFDQEVLITLAEQAVIAIKNAQLYAEQEKLTIGSIKSLATILDTRARHEYTHPKTFLKMVLAMGEELSLSVEESRALHYAALLHDAGKVMVPDKILKKETPLTGKEYEIIKRHPVKGVEILKPIEILEPVIPIILHHHERFDGTGYPKGLKGGEIPIAARIMAVADTFEAMVSPRPYRKAATIHEAKMEIIRASGSQFDPKVVEAFLKVLKRKEFRDLFKST